MWKRFLVSEIQYINSYFQAEEEVEDAEEEAEEDVS